MQENTSDSTAEPTQSPQETSSSASPVTGESKRTRKPRVAKPKTEKSTGKIVVIEQATIGDELVYKAAQKQPTGLRTKKQLHAWISKNLGAGVFAAVKTVVKVENEEETKVIKTSKLL